MSMQVTFKNSSSATHASPQDLTLIDSKQNSSGLVTDAPGCQTWNRHEFSNGATFGPTNVCFRVSTATPPLVLRWSPDFGILLLSDGHQAFLTARKPSATSGRFVTTAVTLGSPMNRAISLVSSTVQTQTGSRLRLQ